MVAPLVAGAAITAGASLFQGITGGKGAKKAANIAAQSAEKDRQQALAIYNTNMGMARPTVDRGNAAGAQIDALLGLGGNTAAANDALATWRGSTGYQAGLTEGLRSVNTGYAARGALESGAAQKALMKFGTDYSNQNFGQYYGMLQGQQQAGLNALGAATGAGNAYGTMTSNANNAQATAQGNAALYGTQALAQGLAGAAGAFGDFYGDLAHGQSQTSYRAPVPNALASTYSTGGFGGPIRNALPGVGWPSPFSTNPWGQ